MIRLTPGERGFLRTSRNKRIEDQLEHLAEEIRDTVNEKMTDIAPLVLGRHLNQNMDDDDQYWATLSLLTMQFYTKMAAECYYPRASFVDEI